MDEGLIYGILLTALVAASPVVVYVFRARLLRYTLVIVALSYMCLFAIGICRYQSLAARAKYGSLHDGVVPDDFRLGANAAMVVGGRQARFMLLAGFVLALIALIPQEKRRKKGLDVGGQSEGKQETPVRQGDEARRPGK